MHGEALREAVHALQESPGYRPGDYALPVAVIHAACFVPFDDAGGYARNYGGTVRKAERVNRAFQQVLDHSAAAEVLRWRRCSPRTDPLVGPRDGTGTFTIPRLPIRRRLPDNAVRHHPGRRVLLRPRPSRPALAGRSHHVTVEGDAITTVEPARIRRQRRRGDLRRRALTAPRSGGLRGDLSRVAPVVRRGPGTSPEPR